MVIHMQASMQVVTQCAPDLLRTGRKASIHSSQKSPATRRTRSLGQVRRNQDVPGHPQILLHVSPAPVAQAVLHPRPALAIQKGELAYYCVGRQYRSSDPWP